MKKDTARILMIVAGVVILLGIVAIGSAAWLFSQTVNLGKADEGKVEATFAQIRRQFGGAKPILDVQDGEPVLTRQPPASAPASRLSTLHVVAWDPDDEGLTRVDLPFWLVRLKSGPIEISSKSGFDDLNLTVDELERFGPALLVDHVSRSGDRVLIWTEN
jgi:hypothetical protein